VHADDTDHKLSVPAGLWCCSTGY